MPEQHAGPPRAASKATGRKARAALAAAAAAGAVLALAACGSEQPSVSPGFVAVSPSGPASPAPSQGTTVRVGTSLDVVDARIPAPPGGSSTAQVELTLADISATGADVLQSARSPAARAVVFTSNGHAVSKLTVPAAVGAGLTAGPPSPYRVLLTGLRHPLHVGQLVTVSLAFAQAGSTTIQVPVIPAVP